MREEIDFGNWEECPGRRGGGAGGAEWWEIKSRGYRAGRLAQTVETGREANSEQGGGLES